MAVWMALALAICLAPLDSVHARPEWQTIHPGLEFGFIKGDSVVRVGDGKIALLRVQPKQAAIKVLSAEPGRPGFTAGQWRRSSRALAVINAGQHTPEKEYLGLLVKDGRMESRMVAHLKGLLVAEPKGELLPKARVLDLHFTHYNPEQASYAQAAQSLMMLDRFGDIRVRKSDKVAHRTAVAEDERGRILFMVTEGAYTLWELAALFKASGLGLREVMCMDGGAEAQMDIMVQGFSYRHYGSPSSAPELPNLLPSTTIPVALGVFSR
jgi:uncharacterized protein YigE (DUF2233 family)